MVNVDEGLGSGNRLVCVYRYKVIWSESDIDEEAYESVNVIGFDIDEVKATDNVVVRVNGICSL